MTSSSSQDPDLNAYILYRRGVDESRKPATSSTLASALGWFDGALKIDPEYAAAFAGKCAVFVSKYQLNSEPEFVRHAESACSTALELNANLDMVHTALGDLYNLTGQLTESEVAYLKALRTNPRNVLSMTGLAETYRLQRRTDEAEAILQSAIGIQPGNWAPYNALGYFLFQQGRYDESAEQFRQVISLDNQNTRGASNLAASYMMAGDFEKAAPAFEHALMLEKQPNTYSNLGLMYYYLGRYKEAVAALNSAIEFMPREHLPWSNLGDILFVSGDEAGALGAFRVAEELADIALTINPNDPSTLADMSWIQAMLGKQKQAEASIGRAASAAADDPYIDYIRGLINNRYGNTEEALDDFEAAVAKGYPTTILAVEPHLFSLSSNPRFRRIATNN